MAINLIVVATFFVCIAVFRYYYKKPKGAKGKDLFKKIAKNIFVHEEIVDDNKVFVLENKREKNTNATILFLHGGAYIGGITNRHWSFLFRLVEDAKMKIIVPDYPLAIKHTYKDVYAFLDKVCDAFELSEKTIIMGDSAGGALALALSQKITNDRNKKAKKLILISPWLDISLKNEAIDAKVKEDPKLKKSVLNFAAERYSNKEDMDNFLLSPINVDISKLHNVVIFTGTSDLLNPDVHVFEKRFEEANNFELKIYERKSATHNWIIDDLDAKEDYELLLKEVLND